MEQMQEMEDNIHRAKKGDLKVRFTLQML